MYKFGETNQSMALTDFERYCSIWVRNIRQNSLEKKGSSCRDLCMNIFLDVVRNEPGPKIRKP